MLLLSKHAAACNAGMGNSKQQLTFSNHKGATRDAVHTCLLARARSLLVPLAVGRLAKGQPLLCVLGLLDR